MKKREQKLCEEIYTQYAERLYWYIKRHYYDIPEEDIRDVMQDIWVSLSKEIEKVSEMGNERRLYWLFTVCKSKCLDYYRSTKKAWELDDLLQKNYEERRVPSVEKTVTGKLEGWEILESLSPDERKILAAHYFEERPTNLSAKEANALACKNYRLQQKIKNKMGGDKAKKMKPT